MKQALFCALDCEARFFIDQGKLKKTQEIGHFKFYENADTILLIFGIGAQNAFLAPALFKGLYPEFKGALINIGIAGHQTFAIGSLFFVHHVEHSSLKNRYFLNPNSELGLPFFPCQTIENPSKEYLQDFLFDMEAYHWIESALTFFTIDQLFCLKIISDNLLNPMERVHYDLIYPLFREKAVYWKKLSLYLSEHFTCSETSFTKRDLKQLWGFSETESIKIKKLIDRVFALDPHYLLDKNLKKELVEIALQMKIDSYYGL